MTLLRSFGSAARVAVIGASGGIGSGFCRTLADTESVASLFAFSRSGNSSFGDKSVAATIDTADENSVAQAAALAAKDGPLDLVIVATGVLHRDSLQPEKSMGQIEASQLLDVYRTNAVGPALVAKHFLPHLARERKSAFAVLSARVGSISDNRLGGWYAYRASKAAVNMLVKTLSIEHARRFPDSVIAALHPGTVDTALSKPFSKRVPEGKLFDADYSARELLSVIDRLHPDDSGGFFAYDGSRILW